MTINETQASRLSLMTRQDPIDLEFEAGSDASNEIDITQRVCRGVSFAYVTLTECYLSVEFHIDGDVDSVGAEIWYPLKDSSSGVKVLARALDEVSLVVFDAAYWGGLRMHRLRLRSLAADGATPVAQATGATGKLSILA